MKLETISCSVNNNNIVAWFHVRKDSAITDIFFVSYTIQADVYRMNTTNFDEYYNLFKHTLTHKEVTYMLLTRNTSAMLNEKNNPLKDYTQ